MDIKDTEEYKSTRALLNKITMKQETLEEAAEKYARKQCDDMYDDIAPSGGNWGWETSTDFIAGAKWQQERMYSEDEVIEFGEMIAWNMVGKTITESFIRTVSKKLFEQFKKK